MTTQYIISIIATIISGIIVSSITPIAITRFVKKKLTKKIDDVSEAKQIQEIKEELKSIKKEILEMRGKRK